MGRPARGESTPGEPVLDLHGLRVAEAVSRTNAFLLREQARGTISVRVVTGHGTGALKHAIRALLDSHPAVISARPALGRQAAILVLLKPPPGARRASGAGGADGPRAAPRR